MGSEEARYRACLTRRELDVSCETNSPERHQAGWPDDGLAAAAGTALASSSSGSSTASTASMGSMVQSIHAKTGFTNGWYGGRTVRFFYSKNYFCRTPPASTASSKCEGGANYIRTPASNFDPLY